MLELYWLIFVPLNVGLRLVDPETITSIFCYIHMKSSVGELGDLMLLWKLKFLMEAT